jgi:hypothetical protein
MFSEHGQTNKCRMPSSGRKSRASCNNQYNVRRMVSSGMLRLVAVVITDVSEDRSASVIRVTSIGELRTTLAVNHNRRTLVLVTASVVPSSPIPVTLMEAINSSKTSVLT